MYLLKVAYLGWKFHGSQIQKKFRTVEGELVKVMKEKGFLERRVGFASRTDAGVSALANVFAYIGEKPVLGILNSSIKDAVVWAWAEVGDEFRPRKAKLRWYRYFLVGNYAEDKVMKIREFEGRHRSEEVSRVKGRTAVIERIYIEKREFGYVIDFFAPYFLWNEIRRIVGTVMGRTAPPEPLILMEVLYEGVKWKEEKRWVEIFAKKWREEMAKALVLREIAHHPSGPARDPHSSA